MKERVCDTCSWVARLPSKANLFPGQEQFGHCGLGYGADTILVNLLIIHNHKYQHFSQRKNPTNSFRFYSRSRLQKYHRYAVR